MGVTIIDNGFDKFVKNVSQLDGLTISAGITADEVNRKGVSTAFYGSIHNYKAAPGWIERVNDTISLQYKSYAEYLSRSSTIGAITRIGRGMQAIYQGDIRSHLYDTGDLMRSVKYWYKR